MQRTTVATLSYPRPPRHRHRPPRRAWRREQEWTSNRPRLLPPRRPLPPLPCTDKGCYYHLGGRIVWTLWQSVWTR